MNETAITIIGEYINTRDIKSYARWAAEEIIERNIESLNSIVFKYAEPRPPVEIILEFIDEMENFFKFNNEPLFLVAKETAEDILLLFL